MTLPDVIKQVQGKVDSLKAKLTAKEYYLGRRKGVSKNGKPYDFAVKTEDELWKWSDRLETLKAVSEKRLPNYLKPREETATANTLLKVTPEQIKAMKDAGLTPAQIAEVLKKS